MSTELTIKGDVEVLRLQPGDTIIVTVTKGQLSPMLTEELRENVKRNFPGHEVMVANGVSLSVSRGADG
jgi:hypothetical protein